MKVIKFEDRVLYRAGKGKKVKFVDDESKYSEIVVNQETDKIVEVE